MNKDNWNRAITKSKQIMKENIFALERIEIKNRAKTLRKLFVGFLK